MLVGLSKGAVHFFSSSAAVLPHGAIQLNSILMERSFLIVCLVGTGIKPQRMALSKYHTNRKGSNKVRTSARLLLLSVVLLGDFPLLSG